MKEVEGTLLSKPNTEMQFIYIPFEVLKFCSWLPYVSPFGVYPITTTV